MRFVVGYAQCSDARTRCHHCIDGRGDGWIEWSGGGRLVETKLRGVAAPTVKVPFLAVAAAVGARPVAEPHRAVAIAAFVDNLALASTCVVLQQVSGPRVGVEKVGVTAATELVELEN